MAGLIGWYMSLASIFCMFLLVGCGPDAQQTAEPVYGSAPERATTVYRVAIHPLNNPRVLTEVYGPLIEYLNRHILNVQFELEASRDYHVYEDKIRNRGAPLLLTNPWQALLAIGHGYHVIAMVGDADDFRGIFVVRKDSTIQSPADLKGKTVSYPSTTALAACIMPQWFLHQQGIDVNRDIHNRFVGSQESSIMNVYLGEAVAGGTWPLSWRMFQKNHPKEAAELKVMWETPALVNNAFLVRNDMPTSLVEQVRHLLLTLHESTEGRIILSGMENTRFHPADNASYTLVRDFVARFEREVRPVDQR